MGNPRMLVVFTLAAAVVVGLIISLATNNWLFLLLALLAHGVATALVTVVIFRRIDEGSKPDPVEEARQEAEGDRPADTGGLTKSGRRDDREVVL